MLEGEKIILRAMEPDDVNQLYLWENDTDFWQLSNTLIPYSKYFLYEFIAKSNNDLNIDKQLRLIICNKENKNTIGALDLFEYDSVNRRAGIGILIDKNHRNKGIANEAVELMIKHAFNTLNLHQLYCNIIENNIESLNLFTKLGFVQNGIKKDWLLNSMKWHNVAFLQLINKSYF